jgi:hypothetical protein
VSTARDVAPGFAARSLRVWRASQDAVQARGPSPYTGPAGTLRELLG